MVSGNGSEAYLDILFRRGISYVWMEGIFKARISQWNEKGIVESVIQYPVILLSQGYLIVPVLIYNSTKE